MRHRIWLPAAFICSALLVLSHCSSDVAGNGSEVGNAALGYLYFADGSPARGATVALVDSEADPRDTAVTARVLTDSDGRYFVGDVPGGEYNVLGAKGTARSYRPGVAIAALDTTVMPNDTLRAEGSLTGVVKLRDDTVGGDIYVLVLGTNYFAHCDTSGVFSLVGLAEGAYAIRIVTTNSGYGPLDTTFVVRSGVDSVLEDTIWISLNQMPALHELELDYDTMKQVVTLSWPSVQTEEVAQYAVYRRREQPAMEPYARVPASDTSFADSGVIQDSRYEYAVVAVDSDGNEGPLGAVISLTAHGAFEMTRRLPPETLPGVQGRLVFAEGEKLFVSCVKDSLETEWALLGVDVNTGAVTDTIQGPSIPVPLAFAFGGGKVYVANKHGVFVLSRGDAAVDTLELWPNEGGAETIVGDEALFVANGGIHKYALPAGSLVEMYDSPHEWRAGGGLVLVEDTLLSCGWGRGVLGEFSRGLNKLGEWQPRCPDTWKVSTIGADGREGVLAILAYSCRSSQNHTLLLYSVKREYIGRFAFRVKPRDIAVHSGTIAVLVDDNLEFYEVRR